MKKINIKKPSSFFVKSKSQASIKRDQIRVTDLNSRAERDVDLYLTGKISKKELIRRKELNEAKLEKIIDKSYMKTYSVLVTEEELRLFSEFLEQKEFDNYKRDYDLFLYETRPVDPDYQREKAEQLDNIKESVRKFAQRGKKHGYNLNDEDLLYRTSTIADKEVSDSQERSANAELFLYKNPGIKNTKFGKELKENSDKIWEREAKGSWRSDEALRRREQKALDWAKTLRMEGEFRQDSVDKILNDHDKEEKARLQKEKYNPKTDKPLVEIDEDIPIITEPEEKENTKELNKFQRDRKREEFIKNIKELPAKASEKYTEATGRDSLGKDAAILAAGTATLGASAYGIHRYLKNKKKNKDAAEKKYKTSDKKKK